MTRLRSRRDDRAALAESAKLCAWSLAIYAAMALAASYLSKNAMASLVAQAVIAEWGAGRLGVAWSDPNAPVATGSQIAKRALRGAGLGLAAAALVVAFALVTRGATVAANTPAPVAIAMGLIAPGLVAMREELVFRGLVLRVLGSVRSPGAKIVATGLASAAGALGASHVGLPEVLAAGLVGAAFGALWIRERGAWMAWGAHAAWLWATGTLVSGGLVDVRAAKTAWAGGDFGIASGYPAVVVLGAIAVVGIATSRRAARTA